MNNISVCSEPLQSLQTLYDNLWQQAYPRLRQNSCELDTQLGTPGDTRRGLSQLGALRLGA